MPINTSTKQKINTRSSTGTNHTMDQLLHWSTRLRSSRYPFVSRQSKRHTSWKEWSQVE
jgi:hypothetical protein